MLKSDVVKHFGSQAATARALGLQRAAVNKWPERIPPGWAAQLHFITGGKLKYDPKKYQQPVIRSSLHA